MLDNICEKRKKNLEEAKSNILTDTASETTQEQKNIISNTLEKVISSESEESVANTILPEDTPIDLETFPVSVDYGTPEAIGNGNIVYSDLKGLEIQQVSLPQ